MNNIQIHTYKMKSVLENILTNLSPDKISNNFISILPSLKSVYKSVILQLARTRWELTHLQKVFFCTASLSSIQNVKYTYYKKLIYTKNSQNTGFNKKISYPFQRDQESNLLLQIMCNLIHG